jgi:hypothetical protein
MNDQPSTNVKPTDIRDGSGAAWIMWIIGLVINGFVVYLWLVFGSAAAVGADTSGFIVRTAAGIAVSVGGSVVALTLKRNVLGIILIWAMFPIIICFFNPSWLFRMLR